MSEQLIGRRLRGRRRAIVALLCAALLAACATPQLPASGDAVEILDLQCNADGSVAATALRRRPGSLLETEGALLHSADAGLHWSRVGTAVPLTGVVPWFFRDPRNGGGATEPLIVAGYEAGGFLDWTYPLAGWMASPDHGRTWRAEPARLPAVDSRDIMDRPPPLVVVDATGRLATLRRAPSPALLTSDDAGANWVEVRLPQVDFQVYHLRGDGRGRLVVVGRAAPKLLQPSLLVVVQSGDSGRTWSVAFSATADHLACNPRMLGDAGGGMLIYNACAGPGRRLYHSADGGRTWQSSVSARYAFGAYELAVALEDGRWVALSREGSDRRSLVAWLSDDAGARWQRQPTGHAIVAGDPGLDQQAAVALPGGVVIAYVGDAQLLRSADRGLTWQRIDTGLPRRGNYRLGAQCSDGRGLVVLGGGQGMVARSLDAGLTWQRGRLPGAEP